MKAIRDYNDGQWLLLLWAFIVAFLVVGLTISTLVLVVAVLAAVGAAYTTFLYGRERIGRSSTGSLFGRSGGTTVIDTVEPSQAEANRESTSHQTENHEGGGQ